MERINSVSTIKYGIYCLLFILFCGCNRVSEVSVVSKTDDTTNIVVDDIANVVIVDDVVGDEFIVVPAEETNSEIVIQNIPEPVIVKQPKKDITEIYLSQIGVREKTGKNDGQEVEMYLKTVGLGKGYAWCSAYVKWCLVQAEIPNTINAWSPTAENKKHIVFSNRKFNEEPLPGDVGTLYYSKLKRIGHTYFFHQKINESVYESVEGNTSTQGSREGDGVYRRIRSFNSTYSISRWE